MKALLVVAMAILTAGCGIRSDVPLRAKEGESIDTRLLGTWREKDDSENEKWHIRVESEGGAPKFIRVTQEDDGSLRQVDLDAHATCLASGCYLSLNFDRLWDEETGRTTYQIFRYEFMADGSVKLHHKASEHLKKAIRKKRIDGSIDDSSEFAWAKLHTTEAELRDYFAKHGAKAFMMEHSPGTVDEPIHMRRIDLPVNSSAATQ